MEATPHGATETGVASAPVRRSTLRRIEKLKALLGELAVRELDVHAAACFLQCSSSSARNYMLELCGAAIALPPMGAMGDCAADGQTYHLNALLGGEQIHHFLEQLAAPRLCGAARSKGIRSASVRCGGRYFHIMADDTSFALQPRITPLRRDPLVAALFGMAAIPALA